METAVSVGRTYAGRSAEERRSSRREQLIEAAIALYGASGYRATTVLDVCRAARVTPRHFYELFEDSEALLLAAYDRVIDEQRQAISAALEAAPPELEARLRAGLGAAADLWTDERRARLIQREVLGVSDRVERRYTEVMEAFAALLEAEAARFLPDRSPSAHALAARFAIGGLNHAFYTWRWGPAGERFEISELVDRSTSLVLAVLRSGE